MAIDDEPLSSTLDAAIGGLDGFAPARADRNDDGPLQVVILNADLSKVDMATVMAKSAHPGKDNTHGFFGFAGHNDPVGFRAIAIKSLAEQK